jgi:hypothetical protein
MMTPEQKAARRALKGVTPDTDIAGNPLTEEQKATIRETEARWAREDATHPLAVRASTAAAMLDMPPAEGEDG